MGVRSDWGGENKGKKIDGKGMLHKNSPVQKIK